MLLNTVHIRIARGREGRRNADIHGHPNKHSTNLEALLASTVYKVLGDRCTPATIVPAIPDLLGVTAVTDSGESSYSALTQPRRKPYPLSRIGSKGLP